MSEKIRASELPLHVGRRIVGQKHELVSAFPFEGELIVAQFGTGSHVSEATYRPDEELELRE